MAHAVALENTIEPIITVEEIAALLHTVKPPQVKKPKNTQVRKCAHVRCQLTKGSDSQDPLKQLFIDVLFVEFTDGKHQCAEGIERVAKVLHYIINEM